MIPSDSLPVSYHGTRDEMLRLGFKTGLLTLVTLGIYRFWQKTRIRKYIWSSIEAGGERFEYTGTGLEKLLGFLIAIVFLAVYLGAIQMLLLYFGISMMVEPTTQAEMIGQLIAVYVSFFAVLPFLLFAVYRARRYKMARTRWRGIRFGMEKGAWGYVLRAIGHGLLTILTLGILLPRQTFHLEKYMTERSWYGDERFHQGGGWKKLYGAMKHVFIGMALLVLAVVLNIAGIQSGNGLVVAGAIAGVVAYVWLIVGAIYYQVRSFGYLTSHKTLGEHVGFTAVPRTGTVLKTWIVGVLLIAVLAAIGFGILFGIVFAIGQTGSQSLGIAAIVIMVVGYVALLVLIQAMALAFITQPILAHYVETITVHNPEALDDIHQRAAETGIDADGFADALDIGGAI